MIRLAKKQLHLMFGRYVSNLRLLGIDTSTYRLDNYPMYGGYKIVSVDSAGAECDIHSSNRLSTREMYYSLLITNQTLEKIIRNKD